MASLAIDDDLHQKLKVRCSELGLKIKDIVNEIISDWLKKYEKTGKGNSGLFSILLIFGLLVFFSSVYFVKAVELNQSNLSTYIRGSNGSTGYTDLNAINATDNQIRNSTLTGWVCAQNQCNFSIILNNQNYSSVSNYLNLTNFTRVTGVYYNASDSSWRNISELQSIGQGIWNFTRLTSLRTNVSYALAGGDGYDYGISDALAGGSYVYNENGSSLTKGLVVYWKFSEGSGNTTKDSSGYGNDGTQHGINLTGNLTSGWNSTDCKYGSCLRFDGIDDYLNVPDSASLDIANAITISAWIKRTGVQGATEQNIVYRNNGYRFRITTTLECLVQNATNFYQATGTSISANVWHYVVMTWDGNNTQCYLDGATSGSPTTMTGTLQTGTTFYIGSNGGSGPTGNFFNGTIDEVKVYKRALSSDEIKRDYESHYLYKLKNDFLTVQDDGSIEILNSTGTDTTGKIFYNDILANKVDDSGIGSIYNGVNGTANMSVYFFDWQSNAWKLWEKNNYINNLVGYWKMDEGLGTSTADSSGFGNTGTLNATWFINSSCKYGACLNFNGSQYVNASNASSLNPTSGLTVEAWVKPSTTGVAEFFLFKGINTAAWSNQQYRLLKNADNTVAFQIVDSNDTGYSGGGSTTTLSANTWYHIIGTWDGNNKYLYVNGKLEGIQSASFSSLKTTVGSLTIGSAAGSTMFNGIMDDAKIWNRALTSEEVKAEYENTARGTPDWTDTRFKQEFKWRYRFDNTTSQTAPSLNITYLMTASDPFVRVFVDAKNNSASHSITIPINLGQNKTLQTINQNKPAEYFTTSGGATESVLFTTQNFKNNTHNYNLSVSSNQLNHSYTFNSTNNNNFLFALGYSSSINTASFDPTIAQLGFSNETLESVANSTLTYYDLSDNKLVGWWKFNRDGTNDIALDSSGWNNTGVLTNMNLSGNATSGWMTNSSCKYGACLNFDGVDDWVSVPNSPSLAPTDAITVSMWVKPYDVSTNAMILTKPQDDYWIQTSSSKFVVGVNCGGANDKTTTGNTVLSNNVWYHLVMTYDKSYVRIYVNGTEDNSNPTAASCSIAQRGNVLNIGSRGSVGQSWSKVALDNVKIYSRALTAEEIKSDYLATADNYPNWAKTEITSGAQHSIPTSWNYDGGAAGVWHFDEGSGSTATDSSSNGNSGNLTSMNITGNTTSGWNSTDCKYGSCLKFDGIDDIVNVSNSGNLNPSQITITAWIKPNNVTDTNKRIVAKGGSVSIYDLWITDTSTLRFRITNSTNDASDVITDATITVNVWAFVSAVYDYSSNRYEIYINGILSKSGTPKGNILTTNTVGLAIGGYNVNSPSSFFNGTIDEVRIYPRALTATEVWEHYSKEVSKYYDDFNTISGSNSGKYRYYGTEDTNTTLQPITPKDTVLHLRFNDNSTVNVTDVSGSGNNGRTDGATWFTNSSCKTSFGSCMNFDGSNDIVNVSSSSGLNPTSAITVSAWVNFDTVSPTTAAMVVAKGDWGGTRQYALELENANTMMFEVYDSGQTQYFARSTTKISAGKWYHLLGTYDGTNVKIYINGTLEASTSGPSSLVTSTNDLLIGNVKSRSYWVDGIIDEVLIINRSLSADEIYQLYQGGYNRHAGDLVGWWKFNDGSGSLNALDSSGFGNTGNLTSMNTTGNATSGWNSTDCKYGNCLKFDGVNDQVRITNFNPTSFDKVTVMLWVKFNNVSNNVMLRDTNDKIYAQMFSSNFRWLVNDGTDHTVTGTTTVQADTWYFYTGVFDGSNVRLYVNGSAEGTSTTATPPLSPASTFEISHSTSLTNGTIDNVKIYKRALSPDEIKEEYNQSHDQYSMYSYQHRVASADGITTTAYNLTDKDFSSQKDYDQRLLLITGDLPQIIITVDNLNSTTDNKAKRSDFLNITINESSDIQGSPTSSLVFPNNSVISLSLANKATNIWTTNYTFKANDPPGNYSINVTDDSFTNRTNNTMTSTIVITLESDKMSSNRKMVARPNKNIYGYGKATYDSDNTNLANTTLNFTYDSNNLGTNTTNGTGNYEFTFQIAYTGNYTYRITINDTYNNSGSNTSVLTISLRPVYAKYVMSYQLGTNKSNDIYRLGNGANASVGVLNITNTQYANNLTHAFVCTYDKTEYTNGLLLSLIHSGDNAYLDFVNFTTNQTKNYTLELRQQVDNAQMLLAYTKGDCQDINDKMYLVEKQTIPSNPFASFSLGSPTELPVLIYVTYDRLLLNGTDRFTTGNYKVCSANQGLGSANKPIIWVRVC